MTHLQNALTPAKAHGKSIERESDFRSRISDLRDKIAELRDYPLLSALGQTHVSTLDTLEERLDDIEAYIDAKVAFDTHMDTVETEVDALQQTAAPYLNYEAYLTRPAYSRCQQARRTASEAIDVLRDKTELDCLSAPDQDRFTAAVETVSQVEECLNGYNEEFVSRERDRFECLFTESIRTISI